MKTDYSEVGLISIEDFGSAINWLAEKSAVLEDRWKLEEYTEQHGQFV